MFSGLIYFQVLPSPRAATSVATSIGDFPVRNSVKIKKNVLIKQNKFF